MDTEEEMSGLCLPPLPLLLSVGCGPVLDSGRAVLFLKLIVAQLVKQFSTFHGTLWFITVVTKARP